eukprot:CAMPEP_0182421274 /NCGR_PEP_ID=MMETSP1167-20130531/6586_1 /TAXON_ID=2988 /ORGANISM="Mallomonas Sp, Strain CCMP3275" /LENGTH=383 /DNA_ID=CAMNT_0024598233 /DNA_START=128 /DNA_END=1275 /DNA_ORIENTATION=-
MKSPTELLSSIDDTNDSNCLKPSKLSWLKVTVAALSIFAITGSGLPSPAVAADTVAVGKCLLQNCQKELAQCILNPKCLANVICLNTCNDRKDEADCQIKCGDIFENDVVGVFNACAVSQRKCVPQKQDEGLYPIPAKESLVTKFDTSIWNGRWYISAGLNKLFDTFDCQAHFFTSPYPGKFYAKLFWRVTEPDGEFFTKNAIQRFVQDTSNPAIMYNHDNDYLHYKDDWYIVDYEPNNFVLVYYRGSNDAWDGYGGAFLYTKSPSVDPALFPRLTEAVARMKIPYQWSDFTLTDNSCKEQVESPVILREKYASKLLITEEETLQQQLTAARNAAVNTIIEDEKGAAKSIDFLEKELEIFQNEAKKDVTGIEEAVVKFENAVL